MCIGTLLDQREENIAFFNGWIVEPTMEYWSTIKSNGFFDACNNFEIFPGITFKK